MLVTIAQTLSIGRVLQLRPLQRDRPDRRAPVPADRGARAGLTAAAALAESNARRRITLDDGRNSQNPDPRSTPTARASSSATGSAAATRSGRHGRAGLRLRRLRRSSRPTAADYAVNPRPDEPEDVGGNLTVGSFNVLNYFTTLGGAARRGRHPGGVRAAADEDHRGDHALDADVVGLIEIENNDAALARPRRRPQRARAAPGTLRLHRHRDVIGTDAIKVALIYQPARSRRSAPRDPRLVGTRASSTR